MSATITETANYFNNVVSCLGKGQTQLERRPFLKPRAGELLLRLRVVGLCGTDLFKLAIGSEPKGSVLGHEVVGNVIALGEGVTAFKLGDRIVVPHHVPCGDCIYCQRGNETMCRTFRRNLMKPGGFSDTVLIEAPAVALGAYRLDDQITDAAAVFMEPAACVLRGIRRAGITTDGVAVVQGAGSMGLLHLLVLKAALPGVQVVMIDTDMSRLRFATKLGAAGAAVPGKEAEGILGELSEGADAVFDTVGGANPLNSALSLTRHGGTVVLFAHAPGNEVASFDLNTLFKYERRVIGTYSGALKEQSEIFEFIRSGTLDPSPLVTHTMPLDDFAQGVDLARSRLALKVLFTPSEKNVVGK